MRVHHGIYFVAHKISLHKEPYNNISTIEVPVMKLLVSPNEFAFIFFQPIYFFRHARSRRDISQEHREQAFVKFASAMFGVHLAV